MSSLVAGQWYGSIACHTPCDASARHESTAEGCSSLPRVERQVEQRPQETRDTPTRMAVNGWPLSRKMISRFRRL